MTVRFYACILAVWAICGSSAGYSAEPDAKGLEFFESKIRPVLVKQCYSCHAKNAKKVKGGLLLDSRAAMLAGGENGPAIVPGKPEKSLLISALKHIDYEMPPNVRLPARVIANFEKWVRMGAPDPRKGDRPGVVQKSIDIKKGRQFWAFRPVTNPAAPKVKNISWPRDDIDRFLLAALEKKNLAPVGDADRLTLIRRASYDVTGLPPTPAEVESFLNDKSPKAYENLIDRLLASPRFGERWGRHWLDVAHYAESNGNVRNFTFPHAWRYRDWVINAFNKDLPYDQFVTAQLAGDLLPGDTPQQRNAQKVATGFLAMMSKPQNGKTFSMDLVAEEIEVSTRAFMGLTVACARCHDHKFDPIPTRDYYALAGIFTSSDLLHGGTGKNGSGPKSGLHTLETGNSGLERKIEEHRKKVATLKARQQEIKRLTRRGGAKRRKKKGTKQQPATKNTVDVRKLRAEAKQIARSLKQLQGKGPHGIDVAMGIRDAAKPRNSAIYQKGETPRGEQIPRGFITVSSLGTPLTIPRDASGRLEFAKWLTRGDHPLTSRVMVNRIWHHLFGNGLVRTVDNFGINGERPSHPELLDHLATRFMNGGWSIKRMIRTIMLTRTYQLSADHNAKSNEVDPGNRLLWRRTRRRLEGEAIRDAILAASGQLNLTPPTGSLVAKFGNKIIQDNFTVATFKTAHTQRAVYLPIIRSGIPEVLNVFDFAESTLVVGRRNVTTVPAQELYLMNSPFVVGQSKAFAKSLLDNDKLDNAQRIDQAYRRALCRPATKDEIDNAARFLNNQTMKTEEARLVGWAAFCQALYISAEFRYVN
jgi:hypothetical protein